MTSISEAVMALVAIFQDTNLDVGKAAVAAFVEISKHGNLNYFVSAQSA
jgi:hypothetical protein